MQDIIQMHASWLAVSSIIGCYNKCKYCFLQAKGNNCAKPKELCTPEDAISKLLDSIYYNEVIPVCLLPETDPFLNESNCNYVLKLLKEIEKRDLSNDLIIITKCLIPDYIINQIKLMQNNVIIYLSYSGLEELEPNVNHDNIRTNFKKLKKAKIPTIHYFRPLVPQNADKIEEILDYVNKYTNISTISGLKLIPNFIDKIDFWKEIKEDKLRALKAESVYPKKAYDFFHTKYNHKQKIFHTNVCALCTKLKRPSFYYNSYECQNLDICPKSQRKRCAKCKNIQNYEFLIDRAKELLLKLNKDISRAIFLKTDNGFEIKNVDLEVSDLSYLSYMLNIRVYVTSNKVSNSTYNSMLNGAVPLILGDNNE